MLAYSAVAQAGYIAVGFTAFSNEGIAAALFYGLLYLLMNAAAFLVVARVGADGSNPSLDDLRGLHRRAPLLAATLLLAVFALAGVPPTVGFYAKLSVLQAVIHVDLLWIALAGVFFSIIGAYYYLRVVKLMYFDEPQDSGAIAPRLDMRILISANGLAVLVLGILPQPLMQLCFYSIKGL